MALRRRGSREKRTEPVALPDDLVADVARLLDAGDRIAAVRVVRERAGLGLAEAVRAVDAQADGSGSGR